MSYIIQRTYIYITILKSLYDFTGNSQLASCLFVAFHTAPGHATGMPSGTEQPHICLEEHLCLPCAVRSVACSSKTGSLTAGTTVLPQSPSSCSSFEENRSRSVFS